MMVWAKYGAPRGSLSWMVWRVYRKLLPIVCLFRGHDRVRGSRHYFNPSYMEFGYCCKRCGWFKAKPVEEDWTV